MCPVLAIQDAIASAKEVSVFAQLYPPVVVGMLMSGALIGVVKIMLKDSKEGRDADRSMFQSIIEEDRKGHAEEVAGLRADFTAGFREMRDTYGRRTP